MKLRQEIDAKALIVWREREMQFEPRVRRMNPDTLDHMTGAWLGCVWKAIQNEARQMGVATETLVAMLAVDANS